MKAFKVICFILFFSLVFIYPFITYADSNSDYLNKKDKQAYEYYGSLSEEEFRQLSLDEFIDAIRQNAIVAIEKGGDAADYFSMGIGIASGVYFGSREKALTDRVISAYIKVIQDKSEPWLLRETLIHWASPLEDEEEAEASTISPSTWLKLLKTCQTIMKDKQDNLEIREQAMHLMKRLYPYKEGVLVDESFVQSTWQGIYKDARVVYNDNDETPKTRRAVNNIVEGVIFADYSKLQQNEPLLVFSNKSELMSDFNQDIYKQVDLLRDPDTPYELRYSALEGTASYHDLDIPQSSFIKQQTFTTFYEGKQREDKKFFFELTNAIILWYKDYSIKQDLKEMYEQGNLDKETKNKLRNLIDDIEILEEAEED